MTILLGWLLVACLLETHCGRVCGQTSSSDLNLQCLRSSDPSLVEPIRLESVKQEILLRLQLDSEPENPNPESLKKDEELIMDQYNAVKRAAELNNKVNKTCVDLASLDSTKLSVLFPTSVQTSNSGSVKSRGSYSDTYQLKFDLDLQDKGEIFSADLRLLKLVNDEVDLKSLYDRVDIYLRLSGVPHYYGEDMVLFVTALNVGQSADGYIIFNVKKAIDEWMHIQQSGELVLEVQIRSTEALASGTVFAPNIQFSTDNQTTQLVFRADKDYDTNDRDKRQSNVRPEFCEENPSVPQCCMRNLVINFERDLNWTWIIFPKSIAFNYCSGVCPIGWAITGEHSKFLTLLAIRSARLTNPVAAPNPCCVPNSYYSETIALKKVPHEVPRLEVLENIVITSCVCR